MAKINVAQAKNESNNAAAASVTAYQRKASWHQAAGEKKT